MASIFEQTIVPKINFSNFPLHETQLITCNFGQLIPCYSREVVANDIFTLSAGAAVDFAPMVAAMYQDVNVSMHFFYVPNRIVFEDFETFITGAEDGHEIPEDKVPVYPHMTFEQIANVLEHASLDDAGGSILDYLNLPNFPSDTSIYDEETLKDGIDDTLVRGYYRIWYDYYRDENLQSTLTHQGNEIDTYDFMRLWKRNSNIWDAADTVVLEEYKYRFFNGFKPYYRAYKKDYFTAALSSPQKGAPVQISLGGEIPVTLDTPDVMLGRMTHSGQQVQKELRMLYANNEFDTEDVGNSSSISATQAMSGGYAQFFAGDLIDNPIVTALTGPLVQQDGTPLKLTGDLAKSTAVTVEQLREAFAVQEILESLSMRGSRFTEWLKGNFGVTPDDYRLQRPQFLGGLVTPVQVQKVFNTAGYSGEDSKDMTAYAAGRAYAGVGGRVFRMRFKEPGYIIGIMSIMPKAYYYQGIPRHFLRKDRFDYYMPQFAHLGEQGISNEELYWQPDDHDKNKEVFGFIPRFAEYKTSVNGIHGDFRKSLNYYHMAREFAQLPTLSSAFISTENVQPRPFAYWQDANPEINHLCWVLCQYNVVGSRPMPYHSIPKVI